MADAKVTLEVILKAAGIQPTAEQLKKLNKEMQKTAGRTKQVSNASNKLKRNLEGVAQRAGSTGKDFSRMSQGMGGLVAAYATVAANVFALSSAFLVLRRAADLSSMIKSAEDFSNRFGVSVVNITKRMQEAAGGALDFAEALPSINKAVSAGVGTEQMEELTKAATKAAQTFGGSATEALNRFISASQRGRVEIIQTLGVVIKTEQAYKDYAAAVGKTALELTAFDRQQAILIATIEESNRVFAGVNIDPNPFQQFLTTVTDVKDTILTFVTDGITPLLNVLNKSIPFALISMGLLLKSIIGRIFPVFTGALEKVTKAGIASSRAVTNAQIAAKNKRVQLLNEEVIQVKTLTRRQTQSRLRAILAAHNEEFSKNKTFNAKILNQDGTLNAKRLGQLKAFLGQAASLRAKGTVLKGTEGVSTAAITNARNLAASLGVQSGAFKTAAANQANYSAAIGVTTGRIKEFGRTTLAVFGRVKIAIASTKSAFISGFANTFGAAQTGLNGMKAAIITTTSAWRILVRDIVVGGKLASHTFLTLGKVVGRTAGLLAGVFAVVLGPLFTFFLYLGLAKIAWDALNERFNTGAARMKKLKEAFEAFSETLDEITNRTNNYINGIDNSSRSNLEFIATLEFLRGTLDSTLTAFRDFDLDFASVFDGKGIAATASSMERLSASAEIVQETINATNFRAISQLDPRSSINTTVKDMDNLAVAVESAALSVEHIVEPLDLATEGLQTLAENVGPNLAKNFISLNQLFKTQGVIKFQADAVKGFDNLSTGADKFVQALRTNDVKAFSDALGELEKGSDIAIVFNTLNDALDKYGRNTLLAINAQIAAARSLDNLDNRISNFTSGIDKLRAASVPNKEIVNFFLDVERALGTLEATGNKLGNIGDITSDIIKGEDLEAMKEFFGLGDSDTIESALDTIRKDFEPFKAVIQDTLTAQNESKAIAAQIRAIKLDEAKTDRARVDNIISLNALEQTRAENTRRQLKNQLTVVQAQLRILEARGQAESDTVKLLKSQEEALKQQVTAEGFLLESIRARRDDLRELNKISKESLIATKGVLASTLAIDAVNKQLVGSITEYLDVSKNINLTQKLQLRNRKDFVLLEIKALQVAIKTVEQREKEEAVLRSKLKVIEAETRLLERQQESRLALREEEAPTTIFSQRAIDLTAHFFRRALEKEIPKLKSAFEILGQGFSSTVIDTFDTVLDNLLEGGKDFGQVVREALKANLREVIGDALKNDMKKIFIGLSADISNAFKKDTPLEEISVQAKERSGPLISMERRTELFQTNMLTKAEEQRVLQDRMAMSLESIQTSSAACCANKTATVAKVETAPDVGKAVAQGVDGATVNVDTVNSSPTMESAVMGMGQLVTSASENNTAGILQGLVSLGSTFIAAITASQAADSANAAIGAVGAFGFGTGGMVPGGTSKPMALAGGGLVDRPSLAVIGEGKNTEAVVPLPNNREIPVEMRGGGGDTISIEQNFDFTNAGPDTITQLRNESRAIEDRTFNRVFTEISKGGKYAKISGRRR